MPRKKKNSNEISERITKLQKEVGDIKPSKKPVYFRSDIADAADRAEKSQRIDKLEKQVISLQNDSYRKDSTTEKTYQNQPMDTSIIVNPAEVQTPEDKEKLTDEDKQNIVAQAIREINFARRYKQGKVRNWQKNEEMYYGKKVTQDASRSNVDLGQMQEHVHTILSKVRDPLVFNFTKRKDSQLKRVERLNALKSWDAQRDFWNLKDIVGKKQCIIYGRAAYVYYADSVDANYKPHLENIDIYDLLVDPSGGGIDVEQMLYWGRYGVLKSKESLEAQLEATSDDYTRRAIRDIIEGSGNNTESSQEETNKFTRMYGQNTIGQKELQTDEKFKFWQWFTTYKGTRYVLTLQAIAGKAIEICPLSDKFKSNLWPLFTYAAFLDLTEFWTPSYCDYVRDIIMNQNISINQMNDNAEAINKPMKVVNVSAIENLAELKYRRDGIIKTRGDFDANKAVQILATPSIQTPLQVFNTLEAIKEKASGINAGDKGAEDLRGKVAIYQGNQEASQGRYALFNLSYSFAYDRFALLYQFGVQEHLIKKVAIDIIGPNGIEIEEIKRNDIFKKGDSFRVKVESSNAEKNMNVDKQNIKIEFLTNQEKLQAGSPVKIMNTKKSFEFKAKIAGFDQDEIKELMDVTEYADEELMSEASRDIESLMNDETVKVNQAANNAYKQRFVDYMMDHQEDMSNDQFKRMFDYVAQLDTVIYRNEARALQKFTTDMLNTQSDAAAVAPPAPVQPMNGTAVPVNSNPIQL